MGSPATNTVSLPTKQKPRNDRPLPAGMLRAINAVIATNSDADAARMLNVDPSILKRYRRDERFNSAVRDKLNEIVDRTCRKLTIAAGKAAEHLSNVIADEDARQSDRLKACALVLDYTRDTRDAAVIEKRIAELSRRIQQLGIQDA